MFLNRMQMQYLDFFVVVKYNLNCAEHIFFRGSFLLLTTEKSHSFFKD